MEESAAARSRLPQLAKYEVLEEIGHGGMATVYRARDRRLGREVAVKVIHPHLRDSREVVMRFATEAQAVAKLRHKNIVEVFDVSDAGDAEQYLVAELVRGTTLRKLLQQHKVMPPEVAAAVAVNLLAAIGHANAAGIVHRDVKPENVLVDHTPPGAQASGDALEDRADRAVVKLTDFGIAKLLDAQGVTSTGQVLGSPAHMAPEQIEGGEVDVRADVFGMGVLLYECMVGHLPFEGNNPAQVLRRVLDGQYPEAQAERPAIGMRWSAILDRALSRAPADRYADAAAMREALTAELRRLGIDHPRREIEAWLDDPPVYEESHRARLIERLCALAGEARKQRNVLLAAADYNRALAQAPDDPRLLRIVAGINRAEARARFLRRGALALGLMAGLTAVAFGAGRFLRAHAPSDVRGALTGVQRQSPPPTPAPAESDPAASASAPPSAVATSRPAPPNNAPVQASVPRLVERSVRLNLMPTNGLSVTIDGAEQRHVSSGDVLTLDSRAHALVFSCSVCIPAQREVPASDKDDALVVHVDVKPATLVILGPPEKTYQIVEHPEIPVRVGSNTVRLRSSHENAHVVQIETNTSVSVRLQAGEAVEAPF